MKKTVSLLLLIVFLCSACTETTGNLWRGEFRSENFNETISGLFISDDDATMVFIGDRYHYIFPAEPLFVHAFRYNGNKNLQYTTQRAYINSDRGTARVMLYMQLLPTDNDIQLLEQLHSLANTHLENSDSNHHSQLTKNISSLEQALQAQTNTDPDTKPIRLSFELKGQFYQASEEVNAAAARLESTHEVSVTQSYHYNYPLAGRIALTPVTVAADGALTIGAVVLGAVLIPVIVIAQPRIGW